MGEEPFSARDASPYASRLHDHMSLRPQEKRTIVECAGYDFIEHKYIEIVRKPKVLSWWEEWQARTRLT